MRLLRLFHQALTSISSSAQLYLHTSHPVFKYSPAGLKLHFHDSQFLHLVWKYRPITILFLDLFDVLGFLLLYLVGLFDPGIAR